MNISSVADIASSAITGLPGQSGGSTATQQAPFPDDTVSVGSGNTSAYNLNNASGALAQLGSLLQIASSGTQHINAILGQLQQLAQQASSGNNDTLAQLNEDFQQLLSGIDQIAFGTSFSGTSLLDGTQGAGNVDNSVLSAAIAASGQDASSIPPAIPALTVASLFGSSTPNISTQQSAQSAYQAVAGAQSTVSGAAASLDSAQSQVSFASAYAESALANSYASAATLGESDFGDAFPTLAGVANAPFASASAQTGNLSSSLLALLNE